MDWKNEQLSGGLPSRTEKYSNKSRLFKKKRPDHDAASIVEQEPLLFDEVSEQQEMEPETVVIREETEPEYQQKPAYYGSYGKPKKKRTFFTFTNKLFLSLLAGSIVVNVGAGAVVYKLLKDRKTRFASPVTVAVAQPTTELEKSAIRQVVTWTDEQKAILSKEDRLVIEERFSQAVSDELFSTSNFDFIFVPRVNQFVVRHDGSLSLSAFLHNGYNKSYKVQRLNITCTYEGTIVMSGLQKFNFSESAAKSTNLLQMNFSPDDIRDPKLLEMLVNDQEELKKLRFDVSASYDEGKMFEDNGKLVTQSNEMWAPVKTATVAEKKTSTTTQSTTSTKTTN